MLSYKLNEGKKLVILERPPQNAKIMNNCKSIGLIATRWNCQVKVFWENLSGNYYSCAVNSIKALDELKSCAIKKREISVARGFVRNDGTLRVDPPNQNTRKLEPNFEPFWEKNYKPKTLKKT